jgi:hypothetical protein
VEKEEFYVRGILRRRKNIVDNLIRNENIKRDIKLC